MIIWLASYPKSGNTLLRSMLSAYFFSADGIFNFDLLKNIKQFPDHGLFMKVGIDVENEKEVIKNYINVQETINQKDGNAVRFLKTHSALSDINGYKFTNLENTLGVIYIVRDPRKIIKSYANHSEISIEESKKRILEISRIGGKNDPTNKTTIHAGSWESNYNSWKELKKINRYLLIKYEDLVSEPNKIFLKILNFISKISNTNTLVDQTKLKNVIKTTSFENLQNLESKNKFHESSTIPGEKKIKFFKYGIKNDGIKNIPTELRKDLENSLNKEMKELGYL